MSDLSSFAIELFSLLYGFQKTVWYISLGYLEMKLANSFSCFVYQDAFLPGFRIEAMPHFQKEALQIVQNELF